MNINSFLFQNKLTTILRSQPVAARFVQTPALFEFEIVVHVQVPWGSSESSGCESGSVVVFVILERNERMAKILADQGYQGDLEEDVEAVYGVKFEVVTPGGKGFLGAGEAMDCRTDLGLAR